MLLLEIFSSLGAGRGGAVAIDAAGSPMPAASLSLPRRAPPSLSSLSLSLFSLFLLLLLFPLLLSPSVFLVVRASSFLHSADGVHLTVPLQVQGVDLLRALTEVQQQMEAVQQNITRQEKTIQQQAKTIAEQAKTIAVISTEMERIDRIQQQCCAPTWTLTASNLGIDSPPIVVHSYSADTGASVVRVTAPPPVIDQARRR